MSNFLSLRCAETIRLSWTNQSYPSLVNDHTVMTQNHFFISRSRKSVIGSAISEFVTRKTLVKHKRKRTCMQLKKQPEHHHIRCEAHRPAEQQRRWCRQHHMIQWAIRWAVMDTNNSKHMMVVWAMINQFIKIWVLKWMSRKVYRTIKTKFDWILLLIFKLTFLCRTKVRLFYVFFLCRHKCLFLFLFLCYMSLYTILLLKEHFLMNDLSLLYQHLQTVIKVRFLMRWSLDVYNREVFKNMENFLEFSEIISWWKLKKISENVRNTLPFEHFGSNSFSHLGNNYT